MPMAVERNFGNLAEMYAMVVAVAEVLLAVPGGLLTIQTMMAVEVFDELVMGRVPLYRLSQLFDVWLDEFVSGQSLFDVWVTLLDGCPALAIVDRGTVAKSALLLVALAVVVVRLLV